MTNDSTLTLSGSAAANSTVKVFDGSNWIGTATANSNGTWTYTTAALADGNHNLKATATTSAGTSAASSTLAVRIDTTAPTAPTMATPTNNTNGSLNLTGTAEAGSVVKVFDGATQIGTATANSSGVWGIPPAPFGRFAQPHCEGDRRGRQHRRGVRRGHGQHRHLAASSRTGSANDRLVLERQRHGR